MPPPPPIHCSLHMLPPKHPLLNMPIKPFPLDRIAMPPVPAAHSQKPPVTLFDTTIPMFSFQRKPNTALFTQFQATKAMAEKENYGHVPDGRVHKTGGGGTRRVLMESAPIKETKDLKESTPIKETKDLKESTPDPDPETWEPPPIVDDGEKPPYSYATLIGMAILRAPGRHLTLAQIYKWIADSYQYYSSPNNGWQNSIRHNLSLNKAFVKQERPRDVPGKGNYWVIQKGCELQFMKTKCSHRYGKKASPAATSSPASSSQGSKLASSQAEDATTTAAGKKNKKPTSAEIQVHEDASELPDPMPAPSQSEHAGSTDSTEEGWLSDATRSAGSVSPEPAPRFLLEDDDIFRLSSTQGTIPARSSPPRINIMCSSPPLTRSQLNPSLRDVTPPPLFPSPVMKKRKFSSMNDGGYFSSSMNDSGYFSSLESSVIRPSNADSDKPRIKRGRAEEAIARIREHRSPTRGSTMAPAFCTSSPLWSYDINPMLPPLTPTTTLRLQMPPRSVSPSTNLRIHRDKVRQLVRSPSRDVEILDDAPWGSTLAAFACHEFAMDTTATDDDSSPEHDKFAPGDIFADEGFDTPDLFGVDVYGVMKDGFERFANDCPQSSTAGHDI